jgi:chemotaxis protein histidine kinase CheA
MQERAESLGGSIKITSGPGKGTLIEVALPLPQKLQPTTAGYRSAEDSEARA